MKPLLAILSYVRANDIVDLLRIVCILISIGVVPDEKSTIHFLASFKRHLSPDGSVQSREVGGVFQSMPTYICQICHKEFSPKRVSPTYKPKFCSRTCYGKSNTTNPVERFWRHVSVLGQDDCWKWQRSSARGGYGIFVIGRKKIVAHRYAFFLTHGYFPQKPNEVCHTCDNPPCCNPKHLFDGTRSDNVQDCIAKGRFGNRGGENAAKAKLSWEDVDYIRAVHVRHAKRGEFTTGALAKRFNVGISTITGVISWNHWRKP